MKITMSRLKQIVSEEIERFKTINENIAASDDLMAAMRDMEQLPEPSVVKGAVKDYGERDIDYKDIMSKILKSLTDKDYDDLEVATQDLKKGPVRETRYYDVLKGQRPMPQADAGPYAPEELEITADGLPLGADQEYSGTNPEVSAENALALAVDEGDRAAFNAAVDDLVALGYGNDDIQDLIDAIGRP
tara:strand:+ start:366 stop:932 length:567 start_codon:yes stop_codon:yes gene_type:complete